MYVCRLEKPVRIISFIAMFKIVGNKIWEVFEILVQFQHLFCYLYFSVVYGASVGSRPSVFYCNSDFIQFFFFFLRRCSSAKQKTKSFLLVKTVKSFHCCRELQEDFCQNN